MKRSLLAFSLFALPLWGSFSEPARLEYATGYRNDRLHWHLQDPGDGGPLTYSEVYRDLQFWENALTLTVFHRDIYLFLGADYSAFGQGGVVHQRYANLSYATDQPHFSFTPNGWAGDGTGHFGYCVNLTDGRTYKTILVPFVGFSYHYEWLQRKNPRPNPRFSNDAVGASFYNMYSSLPSNLNLTWYGFLLGGFFHIDTGGRLLFDAGYNYNWLHVRFHTRFANTVDMGPPLSTEESTHFSLKGKTGGNFGHTGWAKFEIRLDNAWRTGLAGYIDYFFSRDFDAKEKQSVAGEPTVKVTQKTKIRWTSFSGLANISRNF
ncbi:MAG: hypothetical protein JSS32_05225 [Verrucomicrobia bacterium]|nr:hypothetical protein [Verrucomicrobiota bacterium]